MSQTIVQFQFYPYCLRLQRDMFTMHSHYSFSCENDLIYIRQSGFRSKHNSETALIKIIDDLLFNVDNDRVSGMVLVDYCKAFDMIDHTLLLKKLEVYGLRRDSLRSFTSYLKDRRQLVKLGEKQSNVAIVRHGIPQGSVLGPLLFIVFTNDLPLYVTSSRIDLFANDTMLTSSANYSSIGRLEGTPKLVNCRNRRLGSLEQTTN